VVAIAAGSTHNLALKIDGTVVGWGSSGGASVPVGLSNVVGIAAGLSTSAAFKSDGRIYVWGDNFYGETNIPITAINTYGLAPGCQAQFVLTVQRPTAPVALAGGNNLVSGDNAFYGENTFYNTNVFVGPVQFSGPILGPMSIGAGAATSGQLLQLNVTPGFGEGMEIDSAIAGHSPAIYLNHTGNGGRNFRIASFGDNVNSGSFVIRDESVGADRLTINSGGILTANGAGLTGLNATNISAGTLPDARLSTNVALLNASQTFTGANSFSSSLGIGTANPQGSLHVYSGNNPTVVRIQSTGTPGFGRVEFVSNPQGDAGEWRPGFIQSLDSGGFTGGIGFYVNGTGIGNRFATNEVMRIQNGRVGIGTNAPTTLLQVGSATCNGTTWANSSDRNAKENFQPVDPLDVLRALVSLPISHWNYRTDAAATHLGPVAQDFHAAFALNGADDTHITTIDEEGVALAAIQGLNQKLDAGNRSSEIRMQKLEAENAELKRTVAELKQMVQSLNQRHDK